MNSGFHGFRHQGFELNVHLCGWFYDKCSQSIKHWMEPKTNGLRSVRCDRAMIDTQVYIGVRSWVRFLGAGFGELQRSCRTTHLSRIGESPKTMPWQWWCRWSWGDFSSSPTRFLVGRYCCNHGVRQTPPFWTWEIRMTSLFYLNSKKSGETKTTKIQLGSVTNSWGDFNSLNFWSFFTSFCLERKSWNNVHTLKLTNCTWKWMVGILLSFWDGLFSGDMLVSGRVLQLISNCKVHPWNKIERHHETKLFFSKKSFLRWSRFNILTKKIVEITCQWQGKLVTI